MGCTSRGDQGKKDLLCILLWLESLGSWGRQGQAGVQCLENNCEAGVGLPAMDKNLYGAAASLLVPLKDRWRLTYLRSLLSQRRVAHSLALDEEETRLIEL